VTTPRIDLGHVSLLAEIVLRGGDIHDPRARQVLQEQYARVNQRYPDLTVGLSCLFRPGASLDDLAREGSYPNGSLSIAVIQRLIDELTAIGYALALYVTPVPQYPSHHTLVITHMGIVEPTLRDEVLDALARAMTTVKNPYRKRKF
jgi:hypothetical protein